MGHSKLFLILLLLVETINSTMYNYCKFDLFKSNVATDGRRFSIPADHKQQIIVEINRNRNNLNKPMNYVNWDVDLDKVALNLLKIITLYETNTIHGVLGCLVRTPLRNDLYVYGDSTIKYVELDIIKDFKLTERDKFCNFITEEQNITSVGCGIWIMKILNSIGVRVPKYHLVCLFSGINGRLLEHTNSNFYNLRGQCVTDFETEYDYLEEKFGINSAILHFMEILTGFTYLLIIFSFVFLIRLKYYRN